MTALLAAGLVVVGVWSAAAWVARVEREAERARRFHRHTLRRHERALRAEREALDRREAPPAPAAVPAPATLRPCGPQPPAVCAAPRRSPLSVQSAREQVLRAVVRHPHHLGGPIVADTDGRTPWRRTMVGCPVHGRRPALFIVVWGWS